eukprot:TRINITY_DN32320_c0_g1_i1.p1 TRINITY_DN32320_c0_g1~~TRINITY_DN32320_c0_g1_i1.p1  ORF type:complete len:150 (+),score=28.85 TRINITY_DN32320_c0_g1_i1:170-619(+)
MLRSLVGSEMCIRDRPSSPSSLSSSSEGAVSVLLPALDANVLASWVSWWERRRRMDHIGDFQHRTAPVSWSMNAVVTTIQQQEATARSESNTARLIIIDNNNNIISANTSEQKVNHNSLTTPIYHITPSSTHRIPPYGWKLLVLSLIHI